MNDSFTFVPLSKSLAPSGQILQAYQQIAGGYGLSVLHKSQTTNLQPTVCTRNHHLFASQPLLSYIFSDLQ